MHKTFAAIAACALATVPLTHAVAQVISDKPVVTQDTGSTRTTVLEIRRLASERYEVIVRYEGSRTGVSYYRNEVDCQTNMHREIFYGDTLEEARQPRPSKSVTPSWTGAMNGSLLEGSIQWRTVRLTCNGQVYH